MTDLEICQKIAEILFQESEMNGWDYSDCGTYIVTGDDNEFNPLTDKALCFDLMVKYEIDLHPKRDGMGVYHKCHWEIHLNGGDFQEFSLADKDPQRAICLAIIAKHEGRNND